MKHLYFCRHGETEANATGVWSGTLETPLTPSGKAQAKLAGKHAKSLNIDHIVCSTLGRAHNTAEIIAGEIGYPLDKIELNSLFIERHFGQMEGQPHDMDMNVDGFIDVETRDTLINRAGLALEYILTIEADNVLLVRHGTFGRALRHVIHPEIDFHPRSTEETRFKNADIVQLI
jgi:probable phosphoglycerate mutase